MTSLEAENFMVYSFCNNVSNDQNYDISTLKRRKYTRSTHKNVWTENKKNYKSSTLKPTLSFGTSLIFWEEN